MNAHVPAYGLWMLVFFNSAIFLMFAFSFFKPQTARDWRTFSAFGALFEAYAAHTPRFLPSWQKASSPA